MKTRPAKHALREGYGQIDYALTRIRGQLPHIPQETQWQRLALVDSYPHFLDAANQQGLGYWVASLARDAPVHAVEIALRARYQAELDTLAGWLPGAYAELLDWCGLLPYLDFVGHLYRGDAAFAWMRLDPVLESWAATDANRIEALLELQSGLDQHHARHVVSRNWLSGFFRRLPGEMYAFGSARETRSLLHCVVNSHPLHETGEREDGCQARLLRLAHRHGMSPPLVPLYTLLVYWMLLRLRGELVPRALATADEAWA